MWTTTWATGLSTISEKLHHLHTHSFKLKSDAIGFASSVCNQNPQCGQVWTERHQPGDTHMNFTQTIPTEEEQTYKGGFEEEGHQTFDCQRRTEDILHSGIVRPVSPELELHGQTGSHPSKVDTNNLPRTLAYLCQSVCGKDVDRFLNSQQERHTERRTKEVVHRGQANCKRDSSTISNIMTPCSSHRRLESEPR